MTYAADIVRASEREIYTTKVRFVGAGAANPTELLGAGVVATWVATGRYLLTWDDNPGLFAGYTWSLQSTTINATRGITVTVGVFDTSAYTLEVDVWDFLAQAAGVTVARDLAALEWLSLNIDFKRARS